jgi:DNA modification methylase
MLEINKIYNEDCLEGMKKLDDDSISIVITSPPYNVGGKYINFKDKSCYCDYYIFIRNTLDELLRVTKNYIFLNFAILEDNKETYLQIMANYRENIKEFFIWAKDSAQPNNSNICRTGFEFIICFTKKEMAISRNFEIMNKKNISNTLVKGSNKENKLKNHQAYFPLWLPEFFISNFSVENDLVLDPFMGSGTTAVACKRLKRNYIGFDIEKEYCDYAFKRIENVPLKLEQFKILGDEDI